MKKQMRKILTPRIKGTVDDKAIERAIKEVRAQYAVKKTSLTRSKKITYPHLVANRKRHVAKHR